MRKRLYLLLAFLWMGVCMLSAQTKNVSGRILSAENDEPIAGARYWSRVHLSGWLLMHMGILR